VIKRLRIKYISEPAITTLKTPLQRFRQHGSAAPTSLNLIFSSQKIKHTSFILSPDQKQGKDQWCWMKASILDG